MKQHFAAKLLVSLFFVATALVPTVAVSTRAFACDLPNGDTNGTLSNDGRTCCPKNSGSDGTSCLYAKYINPLIDLLAGAVGLVVVIAIIFGAIEYITAGGDTQRSAEGRKRIIAALIGLAAFILLYGFIQFIVPGGLLNG